MYILERDPNLKTIHGRLTREQNCPKCNKYYWDKQVEFAETTTYTSSHKTWKIFHIIYHHFTDFCVVKL